MAQKLCVAKRTRFGRERISSRKLITATKNEPIVECQTCKRTYYTDVLENNNYYLDGSPFKKDDYDIEIEPENNETHVIKNCPNCQTKIRLQKGKVGTITCPSCQRKVYTSTK